MKHAYLIMVNSNFRILDLMLSILDDKNNDFYILLDKKVKGLFPTLISYEPKHSKVVGSSQNENLLGGVSQINAVLALLQSAILGDYDYFHFMQGSDFPIKSAKAINDFFEEHAGMEFVSFAPENYNFARYKCNYFHFFVECRYYYRRSVILKALNHGCIRIQRLFKISRGINFIMVLPYFPLHDILQSIFFLWEMLYEKNIDGLLGLMRYITAEVK